MNTPLSWGARGLALLLLSPLAHAGMGLIELPPRPDVDNATPVTVFYPTQADDRTVTRGPFTLQASPDAAPSAGNHRLVIVSHGSGGLPWVHTDVARALVRAGFVVAMPWHAGDNALDSGSPGPESWKRRPTEVSETIDAVAADARLAPQLQLDRVGVFGQSAGGHTALSLAGGVWSPARFLRHCEAHLTEDFNACVGTATRLTGGWLDGFKLWLARTILRSRFDDATPQAYRDPRIAAAVAGVPAAADFDLATLAQPAIPLGLITAGRDLWLTPRWHGEAVAAACTRCERIAHLSEGGHSVLLSPQPPMDRLDSVSAYLLADPKGFDRQVLPALDQRITAFFLRHLSPTQP